MNTKQNSTRASASQKEREGLNKIMRDGVRDGWIEDERTIPASKPELPQNEESNLQSMQQMIEALQWIEKEAAVLAALLDENGSGFQIAEGIEQRAQLELREVI